MSKSLIFTDIHAGVKSDAEIFLNEFRKFFEEFLPEQIENYSLQEGPIFGLGDLFDNRNNLNVKTLSTVYQTFTSLFKRYPKLKIYLLTGNHDIYYRNTREVSSLNVLNEFSNIELITDIKKTSFFGRSVTLCPWITNKDSSDQIFEERADICMGHFEINGFEMVSGIKEYNGIAPKKFEETFKLTFSGHFHLRAEQNGIIYVGNPYQTKWSDYGNTKGVYVLDFRTLQYEFIENINAPIYVKLFLSNIKKGTINLKKEVPNNFISLIVDDRISTNDLDKLNYMISSLNPQSFIIADAEKKYGIVEEIEDCASMSPLQFLQEYTNSLQLPQKIDKNKLVKKMTELYHQVEIN